MKVKVKVKVKVKNLCTTKNKRVVTYFRVVKIKKNWGGVPFSWSFINLHLWF